MSNLPGAKPDAAYPLLDGKNNLNLSESQSNVHLSSGSAFASPKNENALDDQERLIRQDENNDPDRIEITEEQVKDYDPPKLEHRRSSLRGGEQIKISFTNVNFRVNVRASKE